tara:strand:- start:729 stop:905 length:177 start_codon:yes stop_codon:yes gene_type:complete
MDINLSGKHPPAEGFLAGKLQSGLKKLNRQHYQPLPTSNLLTDFNFLNFSNALRSDNA